MEATNNAGVTANDVDRVDEVTFDYPTPELSEPLGNLIVWKVTYGFECVVNIAGCVFHGVSPDGKWLVIERKPMEPGADTPQTPEIPPEVRAAVSSYGTASCAFEWGAHLYVYVRNGDRYRRIALAGSLGQKNP